jgi:DNA mismatch repair protein MutL
VDVNVHPSKLEVKFDDERNVYRFVGAAVRRALSRNDLAPSVSIQEKPDGQGRGNGFSNFELTETGKRPNLDRGPDIGYQPDAAHAQVSQATKPVSTHGFDLERDRIVGQEGQLPSVEGEAVQNVPGGLGVDDQGQRELYHDNQRVPIPEGKGIWQLHGRYILSQIRTGLMIVDQHVAHERILYEKALTSLNTNLPFSQQLLAACDIALVKELLPHLEKLGFDMKLFGKNTVVIEGVPPDVRVGDEHTILEEVISQYKELNKQESGTMDNLAKSFACKAAIKAGQRLSINEMVSLIDQLFATSMPYVCPHGRPVVIKIPIEEFDKRFGR